MKIKRMSKWLKEEHRDKLKLYIYGSMYNAVCATDKYYNTWGKCKAALAVRRALSRWKKIDVPRLEALKNIHAGSRRAFIICNGPSLNKIDLTKLKNEITIGANAIYLNFAKMGFKTTYYVVEDNLVAEDRHKEINKLKGLTKFFAVRLAYCLKRDGDTVFLNHNPHGNPWGEEDRELGIKARFTRDASVVTFGGNTVTYTAMQLAYHFGIREVYLIGCDHDFHVPERYKERDLDENFVIESREDDVNHFAPEYFGKGYRWHNPKVHKIEESYIAAKKFFETHGGKIFNATAGGKLELFERVDYDSLFETGYKNEIFQAFKTRFENLKRLMPLDYPGSHISFDGKTFFHSSVKAQPGISYKIDIILESKGMDFPCFYSENSPPMPFVFMPMRIFQMSNNRYRVYLDRGFDFSFRLPADGWYHFRLCADKKNETTTFYINDLLVEEQKVFYPLHNSYTLGKGYKQRYWKGRMGRVTLTFPGMQGNNEIDLSAGWNSREEGNIE